MSKGAFAKEEVMQEYLSALLTDDTPIVDDTQKQTVQRLFDNMPAAKPEALETTDIPQREQQVRSAPVETKQAIQPAAESTQTLPAEAFQALFFKMAGLTLAVPLTELGGIHQIDKITPLFGRPDWFKGVMTHREQKLSVVDTGAWIMPEKYSEKLADSLNYQYLIMLGDSHWGLACEQLLSTHTLQPDQVKWRESKGKRPWLAGMVKDKMCALINAQEMIALLNRGIDSSESELPRQAGE